MITTFLMGGMGNQAFQIAHTIAFCLKHGDQYQIPQHTVKDQWPVYFTHFPPLTTSFDFFGTYREKGHEYNEIPRKEQIAFEGYWQSYKYFEKYRPQIIEAFKPTIDNQVKKEIASSIPEGIVAIHVRRGDYVGQENMHPVVTMGYLTRAIKHFNYLKYFRFLVFSDDIAWCKEHLNNERIVGSRFRYSENRTAQEDMYAMSICSHNIISNSTYSWWAAWFNANPKKIVVTPHEDDWFGPDYKHLNVSDLLPADWIRIKF